MIVVFGGCLCAEVFCFAIFAFCLYIASTDRISGNENRKIIEMVIWMIDFISNGSKKERVMRILAINRGVHEGHDIYYKSSHCAAINIFINKTVKNGQYEALKAVSYKDIRQNCKNSKKANLPATFCSWLIKEERNGRKYIKRNHGFNRFFECIMYMAFLSIFFIFGPILMISKVVQIIYPWIIVGYLVYNDLLFTNEIDLFQLVMLGVYVILQLILFVLGWKVMRIHWWLWHIEPGQISVYWSHLDKTKMISHTNKFYDDICWYPQVERIVLRMMGKDIGALVMDYCRSIQIEEP